MSKIFIEYLCERLKICEIKDPRKFIWYLFSVNTFIPIENCAIIFVIAQVEKILIGQKHKSYKTVQGVIAH